MDLELITYLCYNRWVPRDRYNFVDIGCGTEAAYMKALSKKHPDWYFLCVDPVIEENSSVGNIDFVKGKAHRVLRKLRDSSVSNVNSEYFLLAASSDKYCALIFKQLRRVLKPNGRLFITQRKDGEDYVVRTLDEFGFEVIAVGDMPEEEVQYNLQSRVNQTIKNILTGYPKRYDTGEIHIPHEAFNWYMFDPTQLQPTFFVAEMKKTQKPTP